MFDYGTIINRSVAVVKKNGWLLVYGALLTGGIASGAGTVSGGGGRNPKPNFNLEDLPQKTSSVLGNSTNFFRAWLASVSPLTWTLLVSGIFLAVIIGIAVALVLKNWAKASLIAGLQLALNDQPTNLTNTSPLGKAKITSLIIFSFISAGITLAVIAFLATFGGILSAWLKNTSAQTVIWAIFIFSAVITLLIFFIFLAMISMYAERLIVLQHQQPWDAWKTALSLSKGNFFGTAIMGIINYVSTTAFGCLTQIIVLIILGIPSLIILLPSYSHKQLPPPIVWVFLVIFVLLFIVTITLISAAAAVFKFSNWNQVFNQVISKEGQSNE